MAESGAILHENFGHVEIAGRKIAFLHGDDKRLFHEVEYSGAYDFLFYGHTHQAEEHLNGADASSIRARFHRARPKQFIVLDLPDGVIDAVEVE